MLDLAGLLAEAECEGHGLRSAARWGDGVEHRADEAMTPASVTKIQVALAALTAMAEGTLDSRERVRLEARHRAPGPTGTSLLVDDVDMSVRDLVPLILTISDNAATDVLIGRVGLEALNALTLRLGMSATAVTTDLMAMLDELARECGFAGYPDLARFEPSRGSDPDEVGLAGSPLGSDPRCRSRPRVEG